MWAVIGVVNVAQEVELCHPEMAMGEKEFRRTLGLVLDALSVHTPKGSPRRRSKGEQP